MLDYIKSMDEDDRYEFLDFLKEFSKIEADELNHSSSSPFSTFDLGGMLKCVNYADIISILGLVRTLLYGLNSADCIMYQVSNSLFESSPTGFENTFKMMKLIMKSDNTCRLPSKVYERNSDGLCFADLTACMLPQLPVDKACMLFNLLVLAEEGSSDIFNISMHDYFQILKNLAGDYEPAKTTLDLIVDDFTQHPSLDTLCELWWFLDFFDGHLHEIKDYTSLSMFDCVDLSNCFKQYKDLSYKVRTIFYLSIKYRDVDESGSISTSLENTSGLHCKQLCAEIERYKEFLSVEQLAELYELELQSYSE